jgi:hypothetical protein
MNPSARPGPSVRNNALLAPHTQPMVLLGAGAMEASGAATS